MTRHHWKNSVIGIACITLLTGCDKGHLAYIVILLAILAGETLDEIFDEPNFPDVYCVYPIDNSSHAEYIAGEIALSIANEVDKLPIGNYDNELMLGARGEMTINGIIGHRFDGISDHTVTANMTDYSRLFKLRQNINGEVNYSDRNEIVTITDNGSRISILIDDPFVVSYECFMDEGGGISDSIVSLSSIGASDNVSSQNGTLTTNFGTFIFQGQ